MRIALKIAYNGNKFHGFVRQPNLKTVEGDLLNSLIKHGIIEDTKESYYRVASRTDKEVSALCNVVAFNTDVSKKRILEELSDEHLDIIAYGISEVKPDFNPRHAKYRQYRYYLPINDLDTKKILSAASCFTGVHDFSNFARIESFRDPVRTIDNIVFTFEGDLLVVDFFAQTFLWHQIRRIISALVKVGNNEIEKEQIIEALENPEKKIDYGLAPAEPLILKDIVYDFEFEYDEKLLKKAGNLERKIISSIEV